MRLRIDLACGQWRVFECDECSLDGAEGWRLILHPCRGGLFQNGQNFTSRETSHDTARATHERTPRNRLTDDNTESQIDIWLRWNPKALWHY